MMEAGAGAVGRSKNTLTYILLILCSLIFIFPLYIALVNSLQKWNAPASFLPSVFKWSNYKDATTMIAFWKYSLNSVIICAIIVATSTVSSGLAGFAFARLRAPGRNLLFFIVLSTMMVPGIVTLIPTYILFHKYGFLDTYVPWLLWGFGGGIGGGAAYFIFFYRQFFAGIPKELEEAARIDGCSIFRTYWNIFLPLSLPVVATVSILSFQWNWGDSINGFIFLKQDHYPLAVALSMLTYTLQDSKQIIQQISIAAGLLSCLPVLVAFFLGQRYIVEGIVATGIKG